MKKNKTLVLLKRTGFTLIELMVVVSLMGLISFIVISSMDSAKENGRDAAMQSEFASLRAKAEQYYNKYNTFGINSEDHNNLCISGYGFGGATGPGLLVDIANSADLNLSNITTDPGTEGGWNKVTCHYSNDVWVVEAPLPDSKPNVAGQTADMYCVDSTGITKIKKNTLKGAPNIYSSLGLSCEDQDSGN